MSLSTLRAFAAVAALAGAAVLPRAAGAGGTSGPGLAWAPASTIITRSSGCDAFTPTLAPDGRLYTGFGDCRGLSGHLAQKRSTGLGVIAGSPATGQVAPTDIDTGKRGAPDIDRSGPEGGLDALGDGSKGKKTCSMLVVGDTLYAWVRNIGSGGTGARLKYSRSYRQAGSSWAWAPWTLSEFGYPVFVQGVSGAYAYVVLSDGPSAYQPADRFVLARVPVGQIADQSAYQFFSGTPSAPAWVDFAHRAQRAAIASAPGHALRNGMTYNAARGRYYWWRATNPPGQSGQRGGGFGVYSAQDVYGPWAQLYATTNWDVDPGERGEFPTPWMSSGPIGTTGTMYLLFSGNDRMSIRKATLAPGY